MSIFTHKYSFERGFEKIEGISTLDIKIDRELRVSRYGETWYTALIVLGKHSSGKTRFLKELSDKSGFLLMDSFTTDHIIHNEVSEKGGVAIDEAEMFIERNIGNKIVHGTYIMAIDDNITSSFELMRFVEKIENIFGQSKFKIVKL